MDAAPTAYGEQPVWQPEQPKFSLMRLLGGLLVMTPALLIAAAILPGVSIPSFRGALVVALFVSAVNFVVPPIIAAIRLPLTLVVDFLLILVVDALCSSSRRSSDRRRISRRLLRRGAARGARRRPRSRRARGAPRRRTTTTPTRCASSSGSRGARASASRTDVPGIVFLEIDGLALPGAAAGDARRQRAEDGALARATAPTGSSSGRRTSRRRPAPARPGSCSARTRTSRRSAGSRRRPASS